jgi:hypothetical protein
MSFTRKEEIEALLATDDSRTGKVWRWQQEGLTMHDMQERLGNSTPPTNETINIAALRDGTNPKSRTTAALAANKVRSWLKSKELSPGLRDEMESQLSELEMIAAPK